VRDGAKQLAHRLQPPHWAVSSRLYEKVDAFVPYARHTCGLFNTDYLRCEHDAPPLGKHEVPVRMLLRSRYREALPKPPSFQNSMINPANPTTGFAA